MTTKKTVKPIIPYRDTQYVGNYYNNDGNEVVQVKINRTYWLADFKKLKGNIPIPPITNLPEED